MHSQATGAEAGPGARQAAADFQARNQPGSENAQKVMRPVVLGTLFGALMLLALAAGVLAAAGRTPRAASAVVVLLWIVAGIVLVVGAGAAPLTSPATAAAVVLCESGGC